MSNIICQETKQLKMLILEKKSLQTILMPDMTLIYGLITTELTALQILTTGSITLEFDYKGNQSAFKIICLPN